MDQASEWRQTCDWKQEYKTEIPSKCWQKTISILNELLSKSKDTFLICVCVCLCVFVKSLQSCLTLCKPMNYSPPNFSVYGIL